MSGAGDWRGLIPASNDPMLYYVVKMQKKFIRNETQNMVDTVASDNEDIYSRGQDVDDVIKLHDELSGATYFQLNKNYFPPFEPDYNIVRLWLRGRGLGNSTKDISGFQRIVAINGDPILVNGNLDLGTMTHGCKSIAMRMNRPTSDLENQEWLEVPDATSLQVIGITTGLSIFVRVRLFSLASQEGRDPTIFEKIDDSTPNNAMMLVAKSDGKLVFIVKRGGTVTAKETPANTVTTNTIYDIFVSFAVSGSVMHVYVNSVDKTLVNFTGNVNWQTNTINHNLFIFRRGATEMEGFVYGDFYDLVYYRDKIVTQAEVTNYYTNKWTISTIPFGQVMIVDHYYAH
jgi:hypothetical protein